MNKECSNYGKIRFCLARSASFDEYLVHKSTVKSNTVLKQFESEMNTMAECDPVFSQVDKLLNLLNKSKLLHILMVLDHKNMPLHFTDIKKRVNSSSTTVTRRLKELEENGLVDRTVHSTVPITVKYSLTPNAKLLAPSIQSMYDWIDEQEIQFA